jgi:hypothetical protein
MNYFTPIFAIFISIFCFWFSIKFIRLYLKVKRWTRINAKIISKEIFIHPKFSSSRSPYGIKATYTYVLNAHTYTGHAVYLAELSKGQVNHMKQTAEHKLQKLENNPLIYVDPADPRHSVIYCDGARLYVFVFIMGLFALIYGMSGLLS